MKLKLQGKIFNDVLEIQKKFQPVLNDYMKEQFHAFPTMAELLGLLE
jgi:hypothetical protein